MPSHAGEEYKFKKGDQLEAIAKKFGLKDGNAIWKLPDNKAIASKRGKPDQLQPGDVLVVPPSEKDIKAARNNANKVAAILDAEIQRTNQKLDKLKALYDQTNANFIQLSKELEANQKHVEHISEAADAAAMVASAIVSLGNIAKKGYSEALAAQKEIAEFGKELATEAQQAAKSLESLKEVAWQAGEPLLDALSKAFSSASDSHNPVVQFVGVLADSWDKMCSPSFWANTFTQLLAGKSWSDAVSQKFTDEFQKQLQQAGAMRGQLEKGLLVRRKLVEALLVKLQAQRKQLESAMKELR